MKKNLSEDQLKHLAQLANLKLTSGELKKFSQQISEVIEFNASHLSKIKTDKAAPSAHDLNLANKMRKDETEPGLSVKEAIKNSKSTHQNFFKVRSVFNPSKKNG